MSDWQPIETAPKDGTPFLACELWSGDMYACTIAVVGDEEIISSHCGQPVVYTPEPTHWQPLPLPPPPRDEDAGG